MAGTRRPRTRRPATTRRTAGSRASATTAASGAPTESAGARGGRTLYTTRALGLGIAIIAVLATLAVPLRAYVAQRADIARMVSEQAAARARVAALEEQRRLLEDPAYIEEQARTRLHFTFPGQTIYLTTTPPVKPGAAPVRHGRSQVGGNAAPWYSRLWQSTAAAGAERPAAASHR